MAQTAVRPWRVERQRYLYRDRWLTHRADRCVTERGEVLVEATLVSTPDEPMPTPPALTADAELAEERSGPAHYARCKRLGLEYSGAYRLVTSVVWRDAFCFDAKLIANSQVRVSLERARSP